MINELRFSIEYYKNKPIKESRKLSINDLPEVIDESLAMVESLIFFATHSANSHKTPCDDVDSHFMNMRGLITQFMLVASLGISEIEERRQELEKIVSKK